MQKTFLERHGWIRWGAGAAAVLVAAAGIAAVLLAYRTGPILRALIVERLSERLHARVELDRFRFSLTDGFWAEGKGLRIWPAASAGASTARPLIALAEFRFHTPLMYRPGRPIRIDRIELTGLVVDVPVRRRLAHALVPGAPATPGGTARLVFSIGDAVCRGARLIIESSKPGRPPLTFDIATLRISRMDAARAMHFDAVLTNPRPKGQIATQGTLGPWEIDDPGATPLDGFYRFRHADLSTFRGIAGTLDSTGRYAGTLRDLTVDGETDTPNFSLAHFGTPLPLHTDFHAHVDATNGDTWLEPVRATLGHSPVIASGKVVHVTAPDATGAMHSLGHEIALRIQVRNGRMADFLRLTSRSGIPLLTGILQLQANFDLPPGSAAIVDRLRMDGRFQLDQARFSNEKVQARIGELSLRGLGKPQQAKSPADADVRSTMSGTFRMANGAIEFPGLVYSVPGAEIDLHGVYGMEDGTLDFQGTAKMQATVSQMVGGWKGALLSPLDRFFKKNGAGTSVHVHIDGTRENPEFGVDL